MPSQPLPTTYIIKRRNIIITESEMAYRLNVMTSTCCSWNDDCSSATQSLKKRCAQEQHLEEARAIKYDHHDESKLSKDDDDEQLQPAAKRIRILEPSASIKKNKNNESSAATSSRLVAATTTTLSPQDHITATLTSHGYQTSIDHCAIETAYYFLPYQEGSIDKDVIRALRQQDIDELRRLHETSSSSSIGESCFRTQRNFLGQSLLHISCRLGLQTTSDFLLNELQVPLNIRDKFGRTPLHYACGTSKLDLDLIRAIVTRHPELILFEDNYGCTPFTYIRRFCYEDCIKLLTFGNKSWWYNGLDNKYKLLKLPDANYNTAGGK